MAGDHFSTVAAAYAESRPSYPPALATFLVGLAAARELAWDCGTGSGQAAAMLAEHFERVVATDLSGAQLSHAVPHARIEYRRGHESASGLPDRSCDLVTAAQAAHWFDLPAFYREVRRVLTPRGVFAIWGYASIHVNSEIDQVLQWFEYERVGPYWPAGREMARNQYRDVSFPFPRIDAPAFVIERTWTCAEMMRLLSSTSGSARCRDIEGVDPVRDIAPRLEPLWGSGRREVRWPIHLLVGRIE